MAELIDYSYARFTPAEVKAAGLAGVVRYVASGRPLVSATRSEVDAIRAAGLVFVAVWQRGADRALLGREAGVADALDARAYCAMLGAGATDPVYFAVDVDVTSAAALAAVLEYFEGAASVLGWDRVGPYGEADVIDYLAARTPMRLYWQTASWSGGRLSAHATLYQYRVDTPTAPVRLLGRAVDFNRSVQGYYGQWGEVVSVAAWRVARSLGRLREQCDAAWPARSTLSDGTIGDAEHATRDSDHNPWYGPGIVTAADITHDPAHGADMHKLAASLVASRDRRIKYLIWDERICSGSAGPAPWTWMAYDGINPHTKHMHVSVVASPLCDDLAPWRLPPGGLHMDTDVADAFAAIPTAAEIAQAVAVRLNPLGTEVHAIAGKVGQLLTALSAAGVESAKRDAAVLAVLADRPAADVDEQALAAELAPLLAEHGVSLDTATLVKAIRVDLSAALAEPAV